MPESIASEIMIILKASPADFIILTLGGCVVMFVLFLWNMVRCLNKKYHILNTNHMALWMKIDPEAVKWHHSGDYHIEVKGQANKNKAY